MLVFEGSWCNLLSGGWKQEKVQPAEKAPQTLEEYAVQIQRFKGISGGYTAYSGRAWNLIPVGQSQPGMNRSSVLTVPFLPHPKHCDKGMG